MNPHIASGTTRSPSEMENAGVPLLRTRLDSPRVPDLPPLVPVLLGRLAIGQNFKLQGSFTEPLPPAPAIFPISRLKARSRSPRRALSRDHPPAKPGLPDRPPTRS